MMRTMKNKGNMMKSDWQDLSEEVALMSSLK